MLFILPYIFHSFPSHCFPIIDISTLLITIKTKMNFLTISITNLKISPSISIFGAVSGSCSVPKWVSNSNKKLGNVGKHGFDSRFNLGYKNVESFRNGRVLVEVMCGRVEIENREEEDAFYMRKCLDLAKQAIGYTSPNPMVGSIIVKESKIVDQSFHPKAGQEV